MLRYIQGYFSTITPMYVDGALYVSIAIFGFLSTVFGGDEAAKYVNPEAVFWIKTTIGTFSAGLLALKLYRSTAFADHLADKKQSAALTPPH